MLCVTSLLAKIGAYSDSLGMSPIYKCFSQQPFSVTVKGGFVSEVIVNF